jgi:hypothetical protein
MKNKVFTIALLLIAAAGMQAQNLPGGIWTSPQSTTTEGRYRSNTDDFIRPDAYSGVKFKKWFGMASFLWDDTFSQIMTAGYAATSGKLYVGAFYSGNFWTSAAANNYTEREFDSTSAPAGGESGKTYNVYNNTISVQPGPVNNIAVLIGVADMGFRLTYRSNYQSFNQSGIVNGGQLYKNYQAERGYIAPQIAWAMARDLTKNNGIRPYITADLVFDRDYQKVETEGGVSGENIVRSLNRFDPVLAAGLGGYTFYNEDGFKGAFDLDYTLTMKIYDNEYSHQENGEYKTGKITGTYSPGINPYVERFFMSNLLTPSLSGSWSKDRLALKVKLNLPVTFSNDEQYSMGKTADGKLVYHGNHDSISTFTFRPDMRLALQYKLVPNRLTLNTGARIQATTLTLETVDRAVYLDGKELDGRSEKIHQNSFINIGSGTQFISRFHVGPTFNFTENAWVEATTGVSNAYGNSETIEIFAPGGLFSFGSILVALKF